MSEAETVEFTPQMRDRLQEAYNEAISENGTDVFIFDGREYYTKYAKYLLEYLNTRFQ